MEARGEDSSVLSIPTSLAQSQEDEQRKIRRHISTFNSFVNQSESSLIDGHKHDDRILLQPNFAHLRKTRLPFHILGSPAEGLCSHYLLKGFIKPLKPRMNVARWTSEGRRLICGTENGDFALWEVSELWIFITFYILTPYYPSLINGLFMTFQHESFKFDRIVRVHFVPAPVSGIIPVPIKSLAWSNYANIGISGDEKGRIKCCNSSLRNLPKLDRDFAHEKNVTGLSFSPMGSKYVSCR
jgi:WD40 repeat protein